MFLVESIKTTSMEDVSTRVLEKIKNIWCIKTYIIAYVKTQKVDSMQEASS